MRTIYDLKQDSTGDKSIYFAVLTAEIEAITTSENVFVDDLSTDAAKMEAIVYVTATTQATDFYWNRESGLRIHVGLDNVHLVPEYEDVDHAGSDDNEYTMSNPNNDDEIGRAHV